MIVELGIGTYPNAPFYARAAPQRIDVVGVDPNEAMEPYAKRAAASAGLEERGHSLRVVSGLPASSPPPLPTTVVRMGKKPAHGVITT